MPAKRKAAKKRPAKRSSTGGSISVLIGRFGYTPDTVKVPKGATVAAALAAAGVDVEGSQRVSLNGDLVAPSKRVSGGDLISIVTPKEAGAF